MAWRGGAPPQGGRAVAFTITRSGTRSAFGDIVVTAAGAKKPVAEIKGIVGVERQFSAMINDPQSEVNLLNENGIYLQADERF